MPSTGTDQAPKAIAAPLGVAAFWQPRAMLGRVLDQADQWRFDAKLPMQAGRSATRKRFVLQSTDTMRSASKRRTGSLPSVHTGTPWPRARRPRRALPQRSMRRRLAGRLSTRPQVHCGQRAIERVELGPQRRLDALLGLVARPQASAKQLGEVVGGVTDVTRATLDDPEPAALHADQRAELTALPSPNRRRRWRSRNGSQLTSIKCTATPDSTA